MSLKIAAIVLAAGRSSRLGRPKQLVPFNGKTLLRHAVQSAIYSPVESVTVVLGAFYPTLVNEVKYLDVNVVKNHDWSEGMGSSLKAGLREVLAKEQESHDGFLFLTCDQPLIDETVLAELCNRFIDRSVLVASAYKSAVGVPAIIGREHLHNLLSIDDDAGARAILKDAGPSLIKVPCKGGEFDIDTASDLRRLKKLGRWFGGGSKSKTHEDLVSVP